MREWIYRRAWWLLDMWSDLARWATRTAAGWHLRAQWAQARLVGWRYRRHRGGRP